MYYKIFNIPVLRFIFKNSRAIPIASARENKALLDAAYRDIDSALDNGEILGIFPEGGLSPDGRLQPFKKGVERIIEQRDVYVIPVAICNLWGSIFSRKEPLHRRIPKRLWRPVELLIGEPIPANEVTADGLRDAVERLQLDYHGQSR